MPGLEGRRSGCSAGRYQQGYVHTWHTASDEAVKTVTWPTRPWAPRGGKPGDGNRETPRGMSL